MPYVAKVDRGVIDKVVEVLAEEVAQVITNNLSVINIYKLVFTTIAFELENYLFPPRMVGETPAADLAKAIYETGKQYGYEGAYLGELNYAITRLIQRVPQIKVANGEWTQELRYWLHAATVSALTYAANKTIENDDGVSGVFEDIKDEYKRRVINAYEAEQILKSGDCYDTPYYTRLVEVVDENGNHIGCQEIMLKRSEETLIKDSLGYLIVLRKK